MAKLTKTICALGAFLLTAPLAFASPTPTLNWGKETNAARCSPRGKPVISIKRRVIDSLDSGFGADVWWARDDYKQNIQVWRSVERKSVEGRDTFCVVSRYQGRFDAFAGFDSPADKGDLSGKERGTFQGGFRGRITGTLKRQPDWRTHGFVGTQNYKCDEDASRGGGAVCPGSVNWMTKYFDNPSLSYSWWGWIYHGGKAGTWVNSSTGNEGNILLP